MLQYKEILMRKQLAILLMTLTFAFCTHAQLLPENAKPEKVADGFKFTEGPALIGNMIVFSDIPASIIAAYNPETGQTQTLIENTEGTNGLMLHRGILYGCSHGRRALVQFTGKPYQLQPLREHLPGTGEDTDKPAIKLNSPNDLAIDSTDGIYFTDPRYGNRDNMETTVEGVYYFRQAIKSDNALLPGREGAYHAIDSELVRPNGIVLSPDEKTLYVADNGANWIYAYDIEEPGKVANKRKLAQLNDGKGGGSDGMCVDAKGRLYATGHGKVWVFEPTGQLVATINVGPQTTNCTFGADGKTLYITANKGLYRITLNTDTPLQHAVKPAE